MSTLNYHFSTSVKRLFWGLSSTDWADPTFRYHRPQILLFRAQSSLDTHRFCHPHPLTSLSDPERLPSVSGSVPRKTLQRHWTRDRSIVFDRGPWPLRFEFGFDRGGHCESRLIAMTRDSSANGFMSGHRLRRWPDMNPYLVKAGSACWERGAKWNPSCLSWEIAQIEHRLTRQVNS